MSAEVQVTVAGETHTLALPIGGLEAVAKVNPQVEEVWQALTFEANGIRIYRLDELRAVLAAGVKHGGAGTTAEAIIEALGARQAATLAGELMGKALGIGEAPPPGKADAAVTPATAGSASDPTLN